MTKAELVVIGGSAGGIQAAVCAQRQQGIKDVILIRQEEKVMVPCAIPYIYGTLGDVNKNVIPDKLLGEAKLKIGEATSIDRSAKTVTLKDGEVIGYNKLVIATGSNPMQPPIPGLDKDNVWFVKKDANYLSHLGSTIGSGKRVVIIGGGFIGVEFADECQKKGCKVTVVEMLDHCLQLVCPQQLCSKVDDSLRASGVNLITGNGVKAITGNGKAEFVELNDGSKIECDSVIVGIGVTPNTKIAQEAGLEIGATHGIKVDEYQKTSDKDIFAIGDCAEKYSFFDKQPVPLRLASVATREGKIAAANLYNSCLKNSGTMGVFCTLVGGTAISVAGLTSERAEKLGYNTILGEAEAASKHPGTMPGSKPVRLSLLFDKDTKKLIGGWACCAETAGEVGNILATAILNEMTMEQVAMLPIGTHPWLTASPLAYQITEAASNAMYKMKENKN